MWSRYLVFVFFFFSSRRRHTRSYGDWSSDVCSSDLNQNLEYAGRVADFMEFAELLCHDALHRRESCGGHFREEFETPDGEARSEERRVGKECRARWWA